MVSLSLKIKSTLTNKAQHLRVVQKIKKQSVDYTSVKNYINPILALQDLSSYKAS